MKRRPSRSTLFKSSLVLATVGLGAHAQQADPVAAEQLREEMTQAVLRAFGLDQPPSFDDMRRPQPVPNASAAATSGGATFSKLEMKVRQILGLAPALSPNEDQQPVAKATPAASATPASGADNVAPAAPALEPDSQIASAAVPTPQPEAAASMNEAAALPQSEPGIAIAGTVTSATAAGGTGAQAAATAGSPASVLAAAQNASGQPVAIALADSALDTMRGGFVGDGGLRISFGIERAVYINGNLVTTTSLNLSELGTLSAGKAAAATTLSEAGNRIALIQNGAGNTVLSDMAPGAIGTVIQNTLNGQTIQGLTTINATVNSLGVLRSIEMQRNLRSAITDSLRR